MNEFEQLNTPAWVVSAALNLVIGKPDVILDAGAGGGAWGKMARCQWPDAKIVGVEIDPALPALVPPGASGEFAGSPTKHGPEQMVLSCAPRNSEVPGAPYDVWIRGDYLQVGRQLELPFMPDLIVSNPPFTKCEQFIRHSVDLLPRGGCCIFLLRAAILHGQERAENLYVRPYMPEHFAALSKRPSFTGNGKTDYKTEYAIFRWRKEVFVDSTFSIIKRQDIEDGCRKCGVKPPVFRHNETPKFNNPSVCKICKGKAFIEHWPGVYLCKTCHEIVQSKMREHAK